jgi:hypothetical protein
VSLYFPGWRLNGSTIARLSQSDINGALVGGAALDAGAFAATCQAAVTNPGSLNACQPGL